MNNIFSYNDFVIFVRAFQEMNFCDFKQEEIQNPYPNWYDYDATYRDEYNYKTTVEFCLSDDGDITWGIWFPCKDAEDEIEELFEDFIKWKSGKRDDRFTRFEEPIMTSLPAQDVEVLHYQDPHKLYVMEVYKKLTDQIERAENGQISFREVFNRFSVRDFLPQYTIVPTSWHVDDIRDRFPEGTSDEELMVELLKIERVLSESAVANGWEVINDCLIQN
ncbi:hypothetical protein M5X00_23205 [Paenibacillus alvei]|uniref:Uncharacterized protein n=1 Tax=Paenibacillus alvei TaxID=44250 RepID=A0ABT4H3A9_PAEAL|nr:hypothetical protein [Paenibacillus alvei]EJW14314.1 hypothetical protein PAV_14c00070 [Paenibacillus alvei DSM 29]MCY9540568.1 hypothetical protein [Paenibacillus alvei]MCY9737314.1 hypothetical protein [Paenibacillus alvei]MCY9757150.1 hypothetical protein [Paenibacillus alvei]MCY9763146.1 hypothetical protein [Paenibacillus alvei]